MKNLNFLLLIVLISITLFSSCRKDIIDDDTKTIFPTPKITVVTDLAIMVVDEQENPLSDVNVTLSSGNYTTDDNGIVQLKGVKLDKAGAMINLSTPDRYDVQKVIIPQAKNQNFLRVTLMRKDNSGNFPSSEGGAVQADLGGQVSFPANSITKADGSAYNGVVNVFARHLNPKSDNLNETMPGNLSALNTDGNEVQLATYGMMVVELESPSGEKLQIAEGKQATIEMPLPSELVADAPQTIPLWHYDTEKGKWVEEGSAELQGDKYVGQVSHFSFWNCDVPFDLVNLQARFVNDNNLPFSFHTVVITNNSNATTGYGWTDDQGNTEGKVPKDENLTLQLLNQCDEVTYEVTIPASSSDIDLGTITVSSTSDNLVRLTGQIMDCNNSPVGNSYAIFKTPILNMTLHLPTNSNGEFDITINFCDNTDGTLIVVDQENLKKSSEISFTVDPAIGVYDFGQIAACVTVDEYITIDTDYPYNKTFISCEYENTGNVAIIQSVGMGQDSLYQIVINTKFPQNHTGVVTEPYNMWLGADGISISDSNKGTMTITHNGGSGDYIEGNIQSNEILHSDPSTTVTTPGTINFRVKID